ncbi:unnamed protein product [Ectocarpus sp. 12 AP-2014]
MSATGTLLAATAFFFLVGFMRQVGAVELDVVPQQGQHHDWVPKTVVSIQNRLVFTMGLEGTGHHFMFQVDDHVHKNNPHLPRMDDFHLDPSFYYAPFTFSINPSHFDDARKRAREQMKEFSIRAKNLTSPGMVEVQRGGISYPNGNGANKVFAYIDVREFAEAAEAENVDFRVLYLRRSAKDLIIANTIHRPFQDYLGDRDTTPPGQRFMEYVRIIFTHMGLVHSFLEELDPAFVICHDWDLLGDPEQAKDVSAFISPTEEMASLFERSLIDSARFHTSFNEDLPEDGSDVLVARLQKKLDTFERLYC